MDTPEPSTGTVATAKTDLGVGRVAVSLSNNGPKEMLFWDWLPQKLPRSIQSSCLPWYPAGPTLRARPLGLAQ